jgi:hypothetical protein
VRIEEAGDSTSVGMREAGSVETARFLGGRVENDPSSSRMQKTVSTTIKGPSLAESLKGRSRSLCMYGANAVLSIGKSAWNLAI